MSGPVSNARTRELFPKTPSIYYRFRTEPDLRFDMALRTLISLWSAPCDITHSTDEPRAYQKESVYASLAGCAPPIECDRADLE
jgi:hypothetical protein